MNRIIVSASGIILTFFWIIYTAPTRPDLPEKSKNVSIKKISKSGSTSTGQIKQLVSKNLKQNSLENKQFFLALNSKERTHEK